MIYKKAKSKFPSGAEEDDGLTDCRADPFWGFLSSISNAVLLKEITEEEGFEQLSDFAAALHKARSDDSTRTTGQREYSRRQVKKRLREKNLSERLDRLERLQKPPTPFGTYLTSTGRRKSKRRVLI